jgi:hypothetical protein
MYIAYIQHLHLVGATAIIQCTGQWPQNCQLHLLAVAFHQLKTADEAALLCKRSSVVFIKLGAVWHQVAPKARQQSPDYHTIPNTSTSKGWCSDLYKQPPFLNVETMLNFYKQ